MSARSNTSSAVLADMRAVFLHVFFLIPSENMALYISRKRCKGRLQLACGLPRKSGPQSLARLLTSLAKSAGHATGRLSTLMAVFGRYGRSPPSSIASEAVGGCAEVAAKSNNHGTGGSVRLCFEESRSPAPFRPMGAPRGITVQRRLFERLAQNWVCLKCNMAAPRIPF